MRFSTNQAEAHPRSRRRLLLVLVAMLLLAAACGGAALSEDAVATIAVAEENQASLALSDDKDSTGLLDGNTGSITSLREVMTGDRAILIWYWAPN